MTGSKASRPVILIILLSILFCSSLSSEIHPAANSTASICILSHDTEFKKNLTAAMVEDFNSKGISVTVDAFSNESRYRAADYNAVILLSGMKFGRPLQGAGRFIKANDYSSNIIYVYTSEKSKSPYGKNEKVPDKDKIDVVTSASVSKGEKAFDEVKNEIISRTMKVLNK